MVCFGDMATAASETFPWHRHLPQFGTEEDLRALRAVLAGYTLAVICRRLDPLVFSMPSAEELAAIPVRSPLDALIRLFHDCCFTSEDALPPNVVALLDRQGLIARDGAPEGTIYSTAAILPVEGALTVCDRGGAPDGSQGPLPPDVVYPPIYQTTRRYLEALPSTPCEALLEIGTGTGIGAILGARHARQVWATDLTARSVHFARLGCRLAGLDNVTVLQGDLYSPVEGLTFDRIAIHPPWVPATQSKYVFGDGGADGEAILRGAIEGLPRFLRPGGRFYAVMLASDREGETVEQRVRRWLGAAEGQFDLALAVYTRNSPAEFLVQNVERGSIGEGSIGSWMEMWKATRTEAVVYAALIAKRRRDQDPGEGEAVTVRVQAGSDYGPHHLEELLDWEALAGGPGATERLMASRPAVAPQCLLKTLGRARQGRFAAEQLTLECAGPFRSSFSCEDWLAQIVGRCDGVQTWREHFDWAQNGGLMPYFLSDGECTRLLASLVRQSLLTCRTADVASGESA